MMNNDWNWIRIRAQTKMYPSRRALRCWSILKLYSYRYRLKYSVAPASGVNYKYQQFPF